jgi:hypothetical protein
MRTLRSVRGLQDRLVNLLGSSVEGRADAGVEAEVAPD